MSTEIPVDTLLKPLQIISRSLGRVIEDAKQCGQEDIQALERFSLLPERAYIFIENPKNGIRRIAEKTKEGYIYRLECDREQVDTLASILFRNQVPVHRQCEEAGKISFILNL
jgi:hypothetical protein